MALFYYREISSDTKIAVWNIEESESFFGQVAKLQYPISHAQKRLQHLAGRYLLHYLYADFPFNLIRISPSGKPYLEDNSYQFSISHSGNYAAAIVSKTNQVGIDIEHKRSTVAKVAHRFLHQEEINQLMNLNQPNLKSNALESTEALNALFLSNIQTLTLIWSAKEAIYKWWGQGNLEFNDMIKIEQWHQNINGNMVAKILLEESIIDLVPNFLFFDDLCLVWLF